MTNDSTLYDRAVEAHTRHARRNGLVAEQPSASLSTAQGGRVILRNVHGELARYRDAGGRLVRSEPRA